MTATAMMAGTATSRVMKMSLALPSVPVTAALIDAVTLCAAAFAATMLAMMVVAMVVRVSCVMWVILVVVVVLVMSPLMPVVIVVLAVLAVVVALVAVVACLPAPLPCPAPTTPTDGSGEARGGSAYTGQKDAGKETRSPTSTTIAARRTRRLTITTFQTAMVRAQRRGSAPTNMKMVDVTGAGMRTPILLAEAPGPPGMQDLPDVPIFPDPAAVQEMFATRVWSTCWTSEAAVGVARPTLRAATDALTMVRPFSGAALLYG